MSYLPLSLLCKYSSVLEFRFFIHRNIEATIYVYTIN